MTASERMPGWMRQRERSSLVIVKLMAWISLTFGRRTGGVVLYGIAAYFTLFSPRARRASRDYLARALERPATWRDTFRHVLAFSTAIHDRIYLLNDRFDLFDIEAHGLDALHAAIAARPGALLVGAHLGSFEVLRALGRKQGGFDVALLMYEENARKINTVLQAINPAATAGIIPLGRPESMLEALASLERGCPVGMLADRSIDDGATAMQPFLGAPAAFPLGPWRLAALLRRPVFLMTGLWLGGNRYRIHFELLADFSELRSGERAAAIDAAQRRYAERLSHYCRMAPYNWFNFFDFWHPR